MENTITAEELKNLIDSGEDFYLVDVLSANSYEANHVPTAVNVPEGPDFVAELEAATGASQEDRVIVYCSSSTCQASVRAYQKLQEAGYENAAHFKGGLAGWQDAGYELEGAAAE